MAHRQRLRGRDGGGHSMNKAQSHKETFFFFKGIASSWRLLAMGMGKVIRKAKSARGQGQLMQVLEGSGRPN